MGVMDAAAQLTFDNGCKHPNFKNHYPLNSHTVSASMQTWGFVFSKLILGEVLFKFDSNGVVFEMGFYQL